jgi:hypothetical protein
MIHRLLSMLGIAALLAATPALSQTQVDPACRDRSATVGKGGDLKAPSKDREKSLSEKLAQSGGVICPPAGVDPDIHEPAPETGRMPVIPPPGTPQNQPNVKPK